jgi:polyisoprenoid-binding protein YceI
MKRTLSGLFVLAFFLAACAPAAAQATSPTQPTTLSSAPTTAAAASASTPAASSAATLPASGKVTFTIVPAESQASYTVNETLFNKNNKINTAIGVTHTVSGDITADLTTPSNTTIGPITIDLSTFVSDSGQRDRYIKNNFLESSKYPTATFVTKTVTGMPASYTDGQSYTFQISGDLTVHNTTQPVTFDVTAKLTGNTLSGEATAQVLMSQFGVGPISLLGILQTQDQVKLTIDFVARPG